MLTNNKITENSVSSVGSPVQSEIVNSTPDENEIISFRITRQRLIVVALVILVAVSIFETLELNELHRALKTWQTLPAVTTSTTPTPTTDTNTLPTQVGGC